MNSPTSALLWEIWRRNRTAFVGVIALAVTGRLLIFFMTAGRTTVAGVESSLLAAVLWMASFVALFGIFNYTESGESRRLGRFPRRLFTLPVSSLRMVAVPMLSGIAAAELLYLLWWHPQSSSETSTGFAVVLLAATMVFYQTTLWTLDRLGALRLVVVGLVVVLMFTVSLLPSLTPDTPSVWRSEGVLAALVAAAAVASFIGSWIHVVRLRSGGGRRVVRLEALGDAVTAWLPRRRTAFASAAAAHFWFEWRCSGIVLPLLTAGLLLLVIAPLSWLARHDPGDTRNFVIAALAAPIFLAIPVGMGFAKPTFWSEDLSLPAFIAVRPLTDDDLVATKVKVAIAGAAMSWLLTIAFVIVWLALWGNVDALRRLMSQVRALHGDSGAAVYGLAVLTVIAAMFLTWRLLVSRLWSGLSGRRPLFMVSAMNLAFVGIAALVFDATRLPGWVLAEPARMTAAVWIAAIVVAAKYALTAYSWRRVATPYVRQYAVVWVVGTACFLTLGFLIWRVARMLAPVDISPLQNLVFWLALLAVPIGRLGLARSSLARNRHK